MNDNFGRHHFYLQFVHMLRYLYPPSPHPFVKSWQSLLLYQQNDTPKHRLAVRGFSVSQMDHLSLFHISVMSLFDRFADVSSHSPIGYGIFVFVHWVINIHSSFFVEDSCTGANPGFPTRKNDPLGSKLP